jgi:hypothetical protein
MLIKKKVIKEMKNENSGQSGWLIGTVLKVTS